MANLEEYRQEIDQLDQGLIELFEKRMEVVRKISEYKKEYNLPILNSTREEEVEKKSIAYLKNKEYSQFIKEFFKVIMECSKRYQAILFNDKNN